MKRRQPVKKFNADELTPSFTRLLKRLAKIMSNFFISNKYTANIWADAKRCGLYGANGHIAFRLPLPSNVGSGAFLGKDLLNFFKPKKVLKLSSNGHFGLLPQGHGFVAKELSEASLPKIEELFAADLKRINAGKTVSAYLSVEVLSDAIALASASGMEMLRIVVYPEIESGGTQTIAGRRPVYILDTRIYDPEGRSIVATASDSKSEAAAGIIAMAQLRPLQPSAFDDYGSERGEGV